MWAPFFDDSIWQAADGTFTASAEDKGRWQLSSHLPEKWDMQFDNIAFHAMPTPFRHLGFFPDLDDQNHPYFDMENGCFTSSKSSRIIDDPATISVFKAFLGTNFDIVSEVLVSNKGRKQLLELLIQYYQIHLHGFSRPKSLDILHEVYS